MIDEKQTNGPDPKTEIERIQDIIKQLNEMDAIEADYKMEIKAEPDSTLFRLIGARTRDGAFRYLGNFRQCEFLKKNIENRLEQAKKYRQAQRDELLKRLDELKNGAETDETTE